MIASATRFVALLGDRRGALGAGLCGRAVEALAAGVPVGVVVLVVRDLAAETLDARRAIVYSLVTVASLATQLVVAQLASARLWLLAYDLGRDLRVRALERLRSRSLGAHRAGRTGDALTALTRDMTQVESFVGWTLPAIVGALAQPVCVLAILAAVDVRLALAASASLAVAAPLLAWTVRRYRGLGEERQRRHADLASEVLEYVQGIAVVRAFNLGGEGHERLRAALESARAVDRRICRRIIPVQGAFMTVVDLGIAAVMAAAAVAVERGAIAPADLAVALVLVLRVYVPLAELSTRAEMLPIVAASVDRIAALLCAAPAPAPAPGPRPLPSGHDVAVENVSFAYPATGAALHDVTLDVPERTMTAIVGPSGAGKTTLLHLLAGLHEPAAGAIRIGGVDLRDLDAEQRSDLVTIVFQDVRLFSATVAENIALGRPDASRHAIVAAARAARCHDFVCALPAGYETVVGEGGATLSGGERQRISIARAVLKDAPIVLLDEPTAALDATNAKHLSQALAALVAEKTVVVVAHRLSTIRAADAIVALERGRIVERGTHDELLVADGLYARFWRQRSRAASWRLGQGRPHAARAR